MSRYLTGVIFFVGGFVVFAATCSRSDKPSEDADEPVKDGVVKGFVYDSLGAALPKVTIRSLDTGHGSVTDNEGRYLLSLTPGEHRFVYSARYFRSDTVGVKVISDSAVVYDVVLESQY